MTVMAAAARPRLLVQYYRWSSSEFNALGAGGGRRALERQVTDGPPPGLVAYVEGSPSAGWGSDRATRWAASSARGPSRRRRRAGLVDPVLPRPARVPPSRGDEGAARRGDPVRACGRGSSSRAYPIDAEGQRLDVTLSYVGFTSTFEAAGSAASSRGGQERRPAALVVAWTWTGRRGAAPSPGEANGASGPGDVPFPSSREALRTRGQEDRRRVERSSQKSAAMRPVASPREERRIVRRGRLSSCRRPRTRSPETG